MNAYTLSFSRFISRLGNEFPAPDWFVQGYRPSMDSELWMARGKFQSTVSIVKTRGHKAWSVLTYRVFDIPSQGSKPFEERLKLLHNS